MPWEGVQLAAPPSPRPCRGSRCCRSQHATRATRPRKRICSARRSSPAPRSASTSRNASSRARGTSSGHTDRGMAARNRSTLCRSVRWATPPTCWPSARAPRPGGRAQTPACAAARAAAAAAAAVGVTIATVAFAAPHRRHRCRRSMSPTRTTRRLEQAPDDDEAWYHRRRHRAVTRAATRSLRPPLRWIRALASRLTLRWAATGMPRQCTAASTGCGRRRSASSMASRSFE